VADDIQGISMTIKALVFDAYGTLFEPHSIAGRVESAFPGLGDFIASIWRQKQLEYSWQRTAMGDFSDFAALTRDALSYAVATSVQGTDATRLDEICAAFDQLELFSDAEAMLKVLQPYRLAVLSNGSRRMLAPLLGHAGIEGCFEAVVSSDEVRAYKPHPDFYRAAMKRLGLQPAEILLVSSSGFDLAGAKHFGLRTLRIERRSPAALRAAVTGGPTISSGLALAALRSQMDGFAGQPDFVTDSLGGIAALLPTIPVEARDACA
jgi:2-haloacid dehalogenase